MNAYEPIGYLASLLVLATFWMRGMVPLRAMAIASNLAFTGYAALVGIDPVLLLHALLLPTNIYRLAQEVRAERRHHSSSRHALLNTRERPAKKTTKRSRKCSLTPLTR